MSNLLLRFLNMISNSNIAHHFNIYIDIDNNINRKNL